MSAKYAWVGIALLAAATCVVAADEPPANFAAALEAAEANEATDAGAKYDEAAGAQFGEKHGEDVNKCAQGVGDADLVKFELLMRLDAAGKVKEALAYPETAVSKCLRDVALKDTYPTPAKGDYWIRVKMAVEQ